MISSSNLAATVSGVGVSYGGSGERGTSPAADTRISASGNSYQNFAGIMSSNQSSAPGTTQNSSVNVSASVGTLAMR